jgi:hypothetical protein
MANELKQNKSFDSSIQKLFSIDKNVKDRLNLDVKVPNYYRNPYEENSPNDQTLLNQAKSEEKKVTTETSQLLENLESLITILSELNKLTRLNKTECPVKASAINDDDQEEKLLINSTTKSCFCQQIYSIINGPENGLSSSFNFIKPFLMGKQNYTN